VDSSIGQDDDGDDDQEINQGDQSQFNAEYAKLDDNGKLMLLRQKYRELGYLTGRSIDCLTKDGILLYRFKNARKLSKLKLPWLGIKACLSGLQKSSSGFCWRYFDENNISLEDRPVSNLLQLIIP
jgi:hypothetical protein